MLIFWRVIFLVADQQSAIPNLKGIYGADELTNDNPSPTDATGPFYNAGRNNKASWRSSGTKQNKPLAIGFDASRVSTVYANGVTEVRPTNIAVRYIIKY